MVNAKIHCPPIGQVLQQRYEIIRLLGSGAFGHTYVARDLQQGKGASCLIKHFQSHRGYPHLLKTSRRIFVTEAEMLKKLGIHDQIPRFIDCFEADEQFYLAQELIVGQPLSEELSLLKHANLRDREAEVIYFLRDLLHVLDFVHSQGIIHCDVKPNNIMRRAKDGRLVLVDFGAAQPIRSPERDRDLIGTLPLKSAVAVSPSGYLAAEQLVGKPYANSDIYATGIVAIQILTGIDPAKLQLNLETNEINWQHIRTRHKSSSALNRALTAILRQMVRYNHQQRYQSAREVLRALEPLLEPARRSLLRASEPAQVVTPTPTPAEVPAAKVAEPTPTPTPVPTKTPALRSPAPAAIKTTQPPTSAAGFQDWQDWQEAEANPQTANGKAAAAATPKTPRQLGPWKASPALMSALTRAGIFVAILNVLAIAFGVYTLADGRGTDPARADWQKPTVPSNRVTWMGRSPSLARSLKTARPMPPRSKQSSSGKPTGSVPPGRSARPNRPLPSKSGQQSWQQWMKSRPLTTGKQRSPR
ncbi:MAG: serine/threonine protein kinase [Spirulinaceae cyanobacterium SM2_1_0]|nr:serine/threonine protein kinase [Spirulinaceae cyanobacterium SM2_1_0]